MKLEILNSLPVLQAQGGRLLLDTGSPDSFARGGRIGFHKSIHLVAEKNRAMDIEKLRELTGLELDGLLGMDILSHQPVLIDYANALLVPEPDIDDDPDWHCELELLLGIPLVEVRLGPARISAFLDTGCTLSYAHHDLSHGLPVKSTREDFSPLYGRYSCDCREMEWQMGGFAFKDEFGTLPLPLEIAMLNFNVRAILGYSLFSRLKVVLDVPNHKLSFYTAFFKSYFK